jgi:hypothetical protein
MGTEIQIDQRRYPVAERRFRRPQAGENVCAVVARLQRHRLSDQRGDLHDLTQAGDSRLKIEDRIDHITLNG